MNTVNRPCPVYDGRAFKCPPNEVCEYCHCQMNNGPATSDLHATLKGMSSGYLSREVREITMATERPSVSAGSTINADLVRRLREVADIMEKENRPLDEADIRVIRASLWELY